MKNASKTASKKNGAQRGTVQANKILRLQVEGGFLDGVVFDFSPYLNALIGGRGAGKTSAFELVPWVLKAAESEATQGSRLKRRTRKERERLRLIDHALGEEGKVKVLIETKEGLQYTVERASGGEPQILDAKGVLTDLKLTHNEIFDIDVYSKNEIERIAEHKDWQLALLDRLAGTPMREVKERIAAVLGQIQKNTGEIDALTKEVQRLEAGIAQLPQLEVKLESVKSQSAAEDDPEHKAAIHEKGLRGRELRELDAAQELLCRPCQALEAIDRALEERWSPSQEVLSGPNGEVMGGLQDALQGAREEARRHLAAIETALESGAVSIRDTRRKLETLHDKQEASYDALMEEHKAVRERAQEQLKLERRLSELHEAQRSRDENRAALSAAQELRGRLRAQISGLRDERFAIRDELAKRLTRQLGGDIEVTVRQGADRKAFLQVIAKAFSQTGKSYKPLLTALVNAFTPGKLVETLAKHTGAADIEHELSCPRDQASWIVLQLRGTSLPAEAEGVDVDDLPRIRLKDGEDWKPAQDLSIGQKCTAVLPILLLESDKPLLIDEPESNLDNGFVFSKVVSRLREVKAQRQLIFVTHNPNIPVLGDASKVFVLQSDGKHAIVAKQGSVDDVREELSQILEGGREAFNARRARYGY